MGEAQLYLEESKPWLLFKVNGLLSPSNWWPWHPYECNKTLWIYEWHTRNKQDVQRFLGLVQYLAHFIPDASVCTDTLASIQKNSHTFLWKPMHQVCMENIKALTCKVPIDHLIMSQYGLSMMCLCQGLALSMDRDLIGDPADPQDLCPRNSRHRNITTVYSRSELLPFLQPSSGGRTNSSATTLMWPPIIGLLNSSRPKGVYPAARCSGWNT